jgi:hypothetical protein
VSEPDSDSESTEASPKCRKSARAVARRRKITGHQIKQRSTGAAEIGTGNSGAYPGRIINCRIEAIPAGQSRGGAKLSDGRLIRAHAVSELNCGATHFIGAERGGLRLTGASLPLR